MSIRNRWTENLTPNAHGSATSVDRYVYPTSTQPLQRVHTERNVNPLVRKHPPVWDTSYISINIHLRSCLDHAGHGLKAPGRCGHHQGCVGYPADGTLHCILAVSPTCNLNTLLHHKTPCTPCTPSWRNREVHDVTLKRFTKQIAKTIPAHI